MDDFQKFILNAAIRAPSGDNCQPWKFRFTDADNLEIYLVPNLATSFFDVDFRATYISIGAVVENIRIAAATKKLLISVKYADFSDENSPIIYVNFFPQTENLPDCPEAMYKAMMSRTVNRRPFFPKNLPVQKWQSLLDVALPKDISAVSYVGHQKSEWTKAIKAADQIRWTHPEIHRELFQKIRYTSNEVKLKRDGLEFDRLGAGPAAKYIMKFLSSWKRQSIINKLGGAAALAEQTAGLAFSSSGLIVVWGSSDQPSSWIRGGEVTQRLWVQAQKLGLAVQPLPVAILLKKRFDVYGEQNFLAKHKSNLQKLSQIVNEFAESNVCNKEPMMLFRVGMAIPMKNVAIRRSTATFIK